MKKKLVYLFSATFFAATLSFFVASNSYAGIFAKSGSSVEAYEDKVAFPGSDCTPRNSDSKFVREQGMYFNTSSTKQTIYCTIPQYNSSKVAKIKVRFHLLDRNDDFDIECFVRARRSNGTVHDEEGVGTYGTGFYIRDTVHVINQQELSGYTYIACHLPAVAAKGGSGIIQYEVQYQ